MKFACVKKFSFASEKYRIASSVTTMMLPSRSVRNRTSSSRAPGREARDSVNCGPAAGGAGSVVLLVLTAGRP